MFFAIVSCVLFIIIHFLAYLHNRLAQTTSTFFYTNHI